MSRYLTLLLMAAIALGLGAQELFFNGRLSEGHETRVASDTAASHITAHMNARNTPTRVLSATQYFTDTIHSWTDGLFIFNTALESDGYIDLYYFSMGTDIHHFDFIGPLYVKKGKIMVEGIPRARVNIERVGGMVMLVERDPAASFPGGARGDSDDLSAESEAAACGGAPAQNRTESES